MLKLFSNRDRDTPYINRHLDVLFGQDVSQAQKITLDWRKMARRQVADAFMEMVKVGSSI